MRKFIVDFEGEEEYKEPTLQLPQYLISWSGPDEAMQHAVASLRSGVDAWVGKLKYKYWEELGGSGERVRWFWGTDDYPSTKNWYYLDTIQKMWKSGMSGRKGSIEIIEVYELKKL